MINKTLINLKINNKMYQVESGIALIQACAIVGIDIPRFCYHEKLSIAGNCRMCLIEVSQPKMAKSIAASCALPVTNNMHVHTNTIIVKRARESVLEFLLINHPLDCPICDQGGECDLQDQTIVFGNDRGRFYDYKRSVIDKYCGPLVKTVMNRCIHCTRCVRFGSEIAGVPFLGTMGRGQTTEITSYFIGLLDSDLSGNIIDLCPVGALTNKTYTYAARSWELNTVETIDVIDSLGSNIRVDYRGLEILRILPRLNEEINEEWITDKTRFSFDSYTKGRLQYPVIKICYKYISVSWQAALGWVGFQFIARQIKNFIGVIGGMVDSETIINLKDFLSKMGKSYYMIENIKNIIIDFRFQYLMNIKLSELENLDICFLIGFSPRLELPLLNVRLRKAVKFGNCEVYSFSYIYDLTYFSYNISNQISLFIKFLEGNSFLCRKFLNSKNPSILMGSSNLERYDSKNLVSFIPKILYNILKKKYKNSFFNLILTNSGFVNGCELGFLSNNALLPYVDEYNFYSNTVFYLIGISDFRFFNKGAYKICPNSLKIFQGHHATLPINIADVILPGIVSIESNSSYLNLNGRLQHTKFVKIPPGFARPDWKIINILSLFMGFSLGYNTLEGVRLRLQQISPKYLKKLNFFECTNDITLNAINSFKNDSFLLFATSFLSPYFNHYLNNVYSSNSFIINQVSQDCFAFDERNFNNS